MNNEMKLNFRRFCGNSALSRLLEVRFLREKQGKDRHFEGFENNTAIFAAHFPLQGKERLLAIDKQIIKKEKNKNGG